MATITDEFMQQMLATTKAYTALILKKGPNFNRPDAMQLIWEHGRKNFALRAEGQFPIICPVNDGSDMAGIGVLNVTLEEAKQLMEADPAVKEGVFVYELHATRSFPGDRLPK